MKNDRPWMEAIEMQYAALHSARPLHEQNLMREADRAALRILPQAQTFSWSQDLTQAAWLASKSIPLDATFSRPSFLDGSFSCWWWFDWPLPIGSSFTNYGEAAAEIEMDAAHINAFLCTYTSDDVLMVIAYRNTKFGPCPTAFYAFPLHVSLSGLIKGKSIRSRRDVEAGRDATLHDPTPTSLTAARFVLAANTWLEQRIAVFSPGHIERHRRKQIAREHDIPIPSDVKVVQLRRSETRITDEETEHVEWSCRWVVNGHWRNQPYKDGKKLIYILPYVKGPEDRPLKVPAQTVYRVNR